MDERVCIERSLRGLMVSKSGETGGNCLPRGLKSEQPSAVGFLAALEAIDAPPRTEGGSPGIVPDQTKLSVTDGAALRGVAPKISWTVVFFHCRLLWA
jgi:hypothetical protein